MECKKNISILSSILFEPLGNVVDTDKINLNLNQIPCTFLISRKIFDYCENQNDLFTFFFKQKCNYKKNYLKIKIPMEIIDNISCYCVEIKSYILHLIYNHWHKNFIDILIRIQEDYELYSAWTNDYDHEIFMNVEINKREVNNKFKQLLSCIN